MDKLASHIRSVKPPLKIKSDSIIPHIPHAKTETDEKKIMPWLTHILPVRQNLSHKLNSIFPAKKLNNLFSFRIITVVTSIKTALLQTYLLNQLIKHISWMAAGILKKFTVSLKSSFKTIIINQLIAVKIAYPVLILHNIRMDLPKENLIFYRAFIKYIPILLYLFPCILNSNVKRKVLHQLH